jgi:hypothetical protein
VLKNHKRVPVTYTLKVETVQTLERLVEEAAGRGEKLTRGGIIDQAIAKAFPDQRSPRSKATIQSSGHGGVLPGVNLDSNAELLDIMEGL